MVILMFASLHTSKFNLSFVFWLKISYSINGINNPSIYFSVLKINNVSFFGIIYFSFMIFSHLPKSINEIF